VLDGVDWPGTHLSLFTTEDSYPDTHWIRDLELVGRLRVREKSLSLSGIKPHLPDCPAHSTATIQIKLSWFLTFLKGVLWWFLGI